MPKLMIVPEDGTIRNSKFFFQIDAGVGLARTNNKDDVAIVQFMLGTLQTIYFGGETVRMDGIAGRNTNAAILAFQQFMKIALPGPAQVACPCDGFRCRPVQGADFQPSPQFDARPAQPDDGQARLQMARHHRRRRLPVGQSEDTPDIWVRGDGGALAAGCFASSVAS